MTQSVEREEDGSALSSQEAAIDQAQRTQSLPTFPAQATSLSSIYESLTEPGEIIPAPTVSSAPVLQPVRLPEPDITPASSPSLVINRLNYIRPMQLGIVALVPYKQGFITQHENGDMYIFDTPTAAPHYFEGYLYPGFFAADDGILVSVDCHNPKQIDIFDIASGTLIKRINVEKVIDCITLIGSQIIIAAERALTESQSLNSERSGQLRFIDINTGQTTKIIKAHSYCIQDMVKLSNTRLLTNSDQAGEIKIWDIPTGNCIATIGLEDSKVVATSNDAIIMHQHRENKYYLVQFGHTNQCIRLLAEDMPIPQAQYIGMIDSHTIASIHATNSGTDFSLNTLGGSYHSHHESHQLGTPFVACYHPVHRCLFIVNESCNLFSTAITETDYSTEDYVTAMETK